MPLWLARPYRCDLITDARRAIADASVGDLSAMQALYRAASAELAGVDPDEVADHRDAHRRAAQGDPTALRAAVDCADQWEALVSVGATIDDPRRFRGFVWVAAHQRYEVGPGGRDAKAFAAYADGASLPEVSAEDAALYVALPALLGLGPEFPEELSSACPLDGPLVGALLGLPGDEWDDVEPLDGHAIAAETCRAHLPGLSGPWRDVVARGLEHGLLVRRG